MLVAPLAALVQRTLTVEQLGALRVEVRVGQRINQNTLLGSLVAAGYDIAVEVSGVGEFASRGGIVDVWPPGAANRCGSTCSATRSSRSAASIQ